MAVTPTSSAAIAVHSARRQIAASATFQSRTGTASVAAALAHVYVGEVLDDQDGLGDQAELLADKRPFALVAIDEQGYQPAAQGVRIHLGASGALVVLICDTARKTDLAGADDPEDSEYDFLNFCYGVLDELADLSGDIDAEADGSNYVAFQSIELVEYDRAPRDERESDDWWMAVFRFSYGVSQ